MCVVAAAEELVCGAERPMDEEDAAAPVGRDRGRGSGGLGFAELEAGVLGDGSGLTAAHLRVQGLGRLGVAALTG